VFGNLQQQSLQSLIGQCCQAVALCTAQCLVQCCQAQNVAISPTVIAQCCQAVTSCLAQCLLQCLQTPTGSFNLNASVTPQPGLTPGIPAGVGAF
jgi:hypothetical protein